MQQEKEKLHLLQFQWRTTLVSDLRFKSQITEATRLARKVSGTAEPPPLHWVHIGFPDESDDDTSNDTGLEQLDEQTCLVHDTLEFIYNDGDTNSCEVDGLLGPLAALTSSPTMLLIERQLLVSDRNPVSVQAISVSSAPMFSCTHSSSRMMTDHSASRSPLPKCRTLLPTCVQCRQRLTMSSSFSTVPTWTDFINAMPG